MNNRKNFGFKNKCGILMSVSSLPSRYGIGSFGKSAFDFVDFLDRCGQKCWQVLPLNPTSYGDSPYQSPASSAGNPYFIDLDILSEQGLLTKAELEEAVNNSKKVDYGWLFNTRYDILRLAYSRFDESDSYNEFCRGNAWWLDDYALFMSLKVHYNYRQWTLWDNEHKNCERARERAEEFSEEIGFWKWLQFCFFTQWRALVDYAHSKDIVIVGDMPIYVAHDSVDVWREPSQFLLDEEYNPTLVAGCPPDAYSADGQLWGNPIYDWDKMKKEGFSWWIDRVSASFKLYDILRIDHFRGFASYYTIPYGDKNARRGKWKDAPGKELFATISKALPDAKIIAEDLGFITDDVRELLEETGFPGMKVIQFAFYTEDSEYLPRMYTTDNCVAYSSSHDSDCTASWYLSLDEEALQRFEEECPVKRDQTPTMATIALTMNSRANLVIIPMQDYLELENEEGRMNTPSVAEGNWGWRASEDYNNDQLVSKIFTLCKKYRRIK